MFTQVRIAVDPEGELMVSGTRIHVWAVSLGKFHAAVCAYLKTFHIYYYLKILSLRR